MAHATLVESNWHMICQCRDPESRRVIGSFATLGPERRREEVGTHDEAA